MIVLSYLSLITTLFLAVYAAFSIKKQFRAFLIFLFYFIIAGITDIIVYLFSLKGIPNILIINLFILVQFALLAVALIDSFSNRVLKLFFIPVCVTVIVISFCLMLNTDYYIQINSTGTAIQNLVLVIAAGILLIQELKHSAIDHNIQCYFWFSAGVFLYFAVTTIVYFTGEIELPDQHILRDFTWPVNLIATIIANCLYFKGIQCLRKTKH